MAGSGPFLTRSGLLAGFHRSVRRIVVDSSAGALILVGAAIVTVLSIIALASPAFAYGRIPSWADTLLFVGLLSAAGALYVFSATLLPRIKSSGALLAAIILVGFVARLGFFGSTPIYEDDWYRYLWDGAVVNAGINPYAASPAQGMQTDLDGNPIARSENATIAQLQAIGADHPHFPERVNYPYVTTIYPPIALGAFAGAHLIAPFHLDAFRAILLLSDGVALAVLIYLLRLYRRSAVWAVLYWWNPIVIVTVFNAGHMDALIAPFLLAAVAFAESRRPRLAAIALAAAAGVKLWPIVLAPIIFRAWRKDTKEIFVTGSVFAAALVVFVGPLILSLQSQFSGLGAYASQWVTNSFVFTYASAGLTVFFENGDRFVRLAAAAGVSAVALWFALSRRGAATPMPAAISLTIVLSFILSPTGYPWYALWFIVFAPFAPMTGAVLFAVTLPIYYLRFLMSAHGWTPLFNFGLTPIEFGAPCAVLLYELRKRPPWRA